MGLWEAATSRERMHASTTPELLQWDAILEAALGELARQVSLHCSERGVLLHLLLVQAQSRAAQFCTSAISVCELRLCHTFFCISFARTQVGGHFEYLSAGSIDKAIRRRTPSILFLIASHRKEKS